MTDATDPPPPDEQSGSQSSPAAVVAAVLAVAAFFTAIALVLDEYQRELWERDVIETNTVIVTFLYLIALVLLLVAALKRRPAPREPEEPAYPLCTHCMRPHVSTVHFCPSCAKPLTVFAATAPYEQIYAQMWALGKAAHHASRTRHFVGMALVAGPVIAAAVLSLGATLIAGGYLAGDTDSWDVMAAVVGIAVTLVMGVIFAALLVLSWRSWRRHGPDPEGPPRETDYGSPTWWSYDAEWVLPEDAYDDASNDDEGSM